MRRSKIPSKSEKLNQSMSEFNNNKKKSPMEPMSKNGLTVKDLFAPLKSGTKNGKIRSNDIPKIQNTRPLQATNFVIAS